MNKGLVYVFTGDGKGKTSASLGVAVRAALSGLNVVIVQWYKEKRWPIAEHKIGEKFENIKIYPLGSGFYKLPSDHAKPEEHSDSAMTAYRMAEQMIKDVDLLILDEICNTIKDKLLTEKAILELVDKRGSTHLILTGRGATKKIKDAADLVTECKKIKHPFDLGKMAVKGLDY